MNLLPSLHALNNSSKISAVIITKNEEENIVACIKSLKDVVDEVIVVDAHSKDKTCALAEASGAKVLTRNWTNFGDQRNYGADQASNEWILSIDADERLDENLKNSMTTKSLDSDTIYAIDVKTNYIGKWINYCGWSPNFKYRLYHKGKAQWSADLVHEHLTWNNRIAKQKLDGTLLHYSYPNLEKHREKTDRYAKLTAQKWSKNNSPPGIFKKLFGPTFRFFRTYILKLGLLDGKAGYQISKMSALLVKKQLLYYKQMQKSK